MKPFATYQKNIFFETRLGTNCDSRKISLWLIHNQGWDVCWEIPILNDTLCHLEYFTIKSTTSCWRCNEFLTWMANNVMSTDAATPNIKLWQFTMDTYFQYDFFSLSMLACCAVSIFQASFDFVDSRVQTEFRLILNFELEVEGETNS